MPILIQSPRTTRRTQGWLTIGWALNVPPVIALYLLVDNETFQRLILLYITIVSIWANFATHWGAYVSATVAEKQEKEQKTE